MPKNRVNTSTFIYSVEGWRVIPIGPKCAITDGDAITLHFESLVELGNFAEHLMDLYNAAKSNDN